MTGKLKGPAHRLWNINVKYKESILIPFVFRNLSSYDCILFSQNLVDKKNEKVKFELIPKTKEGYISAIYGCIWFIDCYRFLYLGIDEIVNNSNNDDLKKTEKDFWINGNVYIKNKLTYVKTLKVSMIIKNPLIFWKRRLLQYTKKKGPRNDQIKRTKEIFKFFNNNNGEELTQLYLKSFVILFYDVIEKFIKVSTNEVGTNP